MCSEEERRAFAELCAPGLSDTLRLHHPEGGLFSWWDYRMLSFSKNRGSRIDAVLASKSLAAKCTASGIDREMRREGGLRSRAGVGGVWELTKRRTPKCRMLNIQNNVDAGIANRKGQRPTTQRSTSNESTIEAAAPQSPER